MASNAQKTPLQISLPNAIQKKVQDAVSLLGKALPAQVVAVMGSIVTVKFLVTTSLFTLPNVTCPVAGPEYARPPTQVGDKGVVIPIDVYLGGVSGLGGGSADISLPGNLSALVFFPIGNTGFSTTDDPNSFVLYGPNGVILRNTANTISVKLTSSGVVIEGSGAALALVTSAFEALFNTHTHPGNNLPPSQLMDSTQLTTILTAQ
jgi:hypothetical protein